MLRCQKIVYAAFLVGYHAISKAPHWGKLKVQGFLRNPKLCGSLETSPQMH